MDSHKEPQINYITPTLDFIGRFEQVQADFSDLLRLLGQKIPEFLRLQNKALPYINSTGF